MKHEVIIVGAGPVGLTLALLLARQGMRSVVLERGDGPSERMGAVSVDDECLRIWQACGLEERMRQEWRAGEDGSVMCRYLDGRGRAFLTLRQRESDLGYPHAVVIHQRRITRALWDEALRTPGIDLLTGVSFEGLVQNDESVAVRYDWACGRTHEARAPWLVACDGGRSAVREAVGIDFRVSDLPNGWLVADIEDPDAEPAVEIRCGRLATVSVPLPEGMRRLEIMLDRGDNGEWSSDEREVRDRLSPAISSGEDFRIVSSRICTFRAGVAGRWRENRVFLVGDAAHVTPPFAGQGLATGLRDASNLSFKLAGVTQGWLPDEVLSTYETERRPHQERLIALALRLGGLMAPRSRAFGTASHAALRGLSRVRAFRGALEMRGPNVRPRYASGFLRPGGRAGVYLPQPDVRTGSGERRRLDSLLGARMTWIALGDGARPGRASGVRVGSDDVMLIEGRDFFDESRTLQRVFGRQSRVLVRPDRVVHTHRPAPLAGALTGRRAPCHGVNDFVLVCS